MKGVLEMDFVSLSMTAPECSFKFATPADGYVFRQTLIMVMLPCFCVLIGLLHMLFSCVISTFAISGSRLKAYLFLIRTVPIEVANACVVAFSTMYVMILSTALEAWNCSTRVNVKVHLDQYPQILCSFMPADASSRYLRIWGGGIGMLALYGAGLPGLFWYTLYTRNKRKIPLYPDDVVWPEARWKLLLKRLWKMLCDCCFNTVTLPCVVLAYLFRDKAALEAIKGRRGRQSHSHATLYILYG